ncbi:hypothetical protein HN51_034237 [Arachis hypogaea]|uniref:Uncharacterized protein n=2 Tax=Arachis hypogaea TaxID=3818 RepID=A0A445A931_ARAHY|nr:protein SHORT-ROOT-like [Arachis ipaensis]QHN99068.1 Protein SHORT-ROOT [Arachis hypogaea]RYR22919.1 hypothetical protein Ahy_B03g068206 [Arachis hypogaea]
MMTSSSLNSDDPCFDGDGKWATKLLRECARAINDRDSSKIQHLLWMLNELASPYGDSQQKLASYFLQALFCKATQTGQRFYMNLKSASEKNQSFDSARKMILKFQEVSPWTTFGHVASNGAILEAFLEAGGEKNKKKKLHIIDISNNTSTFCTQWPTFLESLATKSSDHVETPQLKLTIVLVKESLKGSVMNEICQRMEKFARLMRVPFEINMINGVEHLWKVTKEELGIVVEEEDNDDDDEVFIAVNCVGGLRRVEEGERGNVIGILKSLSPRIVTIVEEESGGSDDSCITRNDDDDFVKCFEECLRFYKIYFEMLEESFPTISNEKLMLERECSRNILVDLGCNNNNNNDSDHNKRERGVEWSMRFREYFTPIGLSDDVVDDVRALLKRYNRSGWSLMLPSSKVEGIYLKWRDQPVLWASAWKP